MQEDQKDFDLGDVKKGAFMLIEDEGVTDEESAVEMLVERGYDEATAHDFWNAWLEVQK